MKINYNSLLEKICKETGMSEEEVNKLVEKKQQELMNIVSKEGALYIVARELGINVKINLMREDEKLKIVHLIPRMSNVNITGKILKIFPLREFEKEKNKGKVLRLLLGDDTGKIMVVIWNESIIDSIIKKFREGDFIVLKNCYTRKNGDKLELHIGRNAKIEKGEAIQLHKHLSDLNIGEFATVRGWIVFCFDMRKVIKENNEIYVLNFIVDDGTDNIRVVLFNNQISQLFNTENLDEIYQNFSSYKKNILGELFEIEGICLENERFKRKEILCKRIRKLNTEEILDEVRKELLFE